MKCFIIFLIISGFVSLIISGGQAYGLWIPQSPQELLDQSQAIFVGNITSVKILEFDKSSSYIISENGIDKEIIENYTLFLDEYTVNIEESIKNTSVPDTITILQPTISLPGRIIGHVGFEIGVRVLFYIQNLDDQNTYSPESFKIPKQCDTRTVLTQKRVQLGDDFRIIQNGIQKTNNFTAGMPMKFVYSMDMNDLNGGGIDVMISIRQQGENETVFEKNIHTESETCEWIASAEWEFTPEEGDYRMFVSVREDGSTDMSDTGFSVVSTTDLNNTMSPLKQFNSGILIGDIQCKENLVLIQKHDGSPACVTYHTGIKLLERGWATCNDEISYGRGHPCGVRSSPGISSDNT